MSDIQFIAESAVVSDPESLNALWQSKTTCVVLPDKVNPDSTWLEAARRSLGSEFSSGSFGLLTSGSTGEPKLVIGNKRRSEHLVQVLHEVQDSADVNETICVLPLSYSYAFVNQWLWSHVFQRPLRLTPGFARPDQLSQALRQARDAMLCLVGSHVSLLRQSIPDATFPGIVRLHFAGGRFPQEHSDYLHQRFPNAVIYNNYGCAEAMPRLCIRRSSDADDASHIGFPLPGVELRAGADDTLQFRSPYRAVAFVDEHGLHALSDEQWVPSGDLGRPLDDGGWSLLGRANDVFKRHGEKISIPRLLETVKSCWDGDAVFYTEADAAGENGWVLVLAPAPDKQQLRDVLMAFRKYHTRPHWPIRLESMKTLPLLPNGKVDQQGLTQMEQEQKQIHWRQRI